MPPLKRMIEINEDTVSWVRPERPSKVDRETNNLRRAFWSHPAYSVFVDLDHTFKWRQGAIGVTLDGGLTSLVTKNHGIWHRAMNETQGDRRIAWVVERTLAFDKDPIVFVSKIEHHFFYH